MYSPKRLPSPSIPLTNTGSNIDGSGGDVRDNNELKHTRGSIRAETASIQGRAFSLVNAHFTLADWVAIIFPFPCFLFITTHTQLLQSFNSTMFTTSYTTSDSSDLYYHLTPAQRLRLIKSTRKLGKILGTTPLLHLTPPARPPLRQRKYQNEGVIEEYENVTMPASTTRADASLLDDPSTRDEMRSDQATMSIPDARQQGISRSSTESHAIEHPHSPTMLALRKSSCRGTTTDGSLRSTHDGSELTRSNPRSPTTPGRRSRRTSSLSFISTSTLTSPLGLRLPSMYQMFSGVSERAAERAEQKKRAKEAKTRRQKMEKLTRHLGENVPPELVFHADTHHMRPDKRIMRRSRSLSSMQTSRSGHEAVRPQNPRERPLPPIPRPSADMARAYLPPQHVILPPKSRSSDGLQLPTPHSLETPSMYIPVHVTDVPIANIPASTTALGAGIASRPTHLRPRRAAPLPRFTSLFYSQARLETEYDAWAAEEARFRRQGSANANIESDMEIAPRSESRLANLLGRAGERERWEPPELAHRRERRQGWSGEWNAPSVQDVIVKLRGLK